jgi:ParB family transcriptional regulator, chromosome partitioning protein
MSEIVSIPLNKLVRSERNVRKTGGESIEDLAASILAHGLLQNLTVVEQPNQKGTSSGKYEVVAGGRRYAALQRLAKEKKIPKSFAVPCKVVEASAAVEASLAENTLRVAMHPADQFIAFRDLIDSGLGVEEVAARFGVTPLFVRQRLKLANVSARFIEAYRAGEMQLEQLEALAITDDHGAQERIWESTQHEWERSAHNLRRLLTEKQISTSDRRARFIGVEAYVAAGGTLERDLFDSGHEGYLTDPALLDRLVAERCETLVADLRAQGWAWAKPYLDRDCWEVLQKYDRLQPVRVELGEDLVEEAEKLRAELDAIDQQYESGEYSEECEGRIDEIQTRLDQIDAARKEFTTEQKSRAGVIITIDHDGKPTYHGGLVERGVKGGASGNGEQSDNDASQDDKDGISAALLEDLTIQRTAALRAELAVRPDIALITITHNLVAQIFYEPMYGLPSSLTVRTDAYTERVDLRSASESQAAKALAKRTHDVRQLLPAKIDALWAWLLEQPQNVLLNVLATAAAHTVNAVQDPHDEPSTGRLGAADALAQALGVDMTNWWQASASNYFGRVKKDQIIRAIEEATGAPVDERLKAFKKKDLAAEAEKSIASTRWLPESLRN